MGKTREVVLVTGRAGSGKTTWVIEQTRHAPRLMVWAAHDDDPYPVQYCERPDVLCEYVMADPSSFRVGYFPSTDQDVLLFRLARAIPRTTLVLEELDTLPDPRRCPEYSRAIHQGRHAETTIYGITLYPYLIPPRLRRQATKLVFFRTHEPRDLEYIERVGGREAAEKARKLRDHEPLIVNLR